jgi:hypothetical protein
MTTEDRPPRRIRLERRQGWRLEEQSPGARSCTRPGVFGNPFALGTHEALARVPAADMVTPWEYEGRVSGDGTRHDMHWPGGEVTVHHVRYMTRAESIATHRRALIAPTTALRLFHRRTRQYVTVDMVRRELAGLDLACSCRLDEACHVDTLLWVANADEVEIKTAAEEEYEIIRAMAERVAQLHPEILAARPLQ